MTDRPPRRRARPSELYRSRRAAEAALAEEGEEGEREEVEPPAEIVVQSPERHRGDFWLGLILGLIGGILVAIIAYRRGGTETRRGMAWGLSIQLVLWIVIRSARR